MAKPSDFAHQVLDLSREIQPMLRGRDPGVQGAVLADLVSLWFAGFTREDDLEPAIQLWLKTMITLIPESQKQRQRMEKDNAE